MNSNEQVDSVLSHSGQADADLPTFILYMGLEAIHLFFRGDGPWKVLKGYYDKMGPYRDLLISLKGVGEEFKVFFDVFDRDKS